MASYQSDVSGKRSSKSCANGSCRQPYIFTHKPTEKLFHDYVFPVRRASLATVLGVYILLTAVLAILYFAYQKAPTEKNLYHVVLCVIGIGLYIFINTRFMTTRKQLQIISYLVWILLLLLAFISLPIGSWISSQKDRLPAYSSQGLWQFLFIIYTMYLILALNFYLVLIFGLVLSLVHTTVLIIRLEDYNNQWAQLMVNVVLMLVTNGVGILVHHVSERTQRKSFINCRAFVGARQECEEQSQKLVKLTEICLPSFMCPEVCADLTMYNYLVCPRNVFPKLYECVGIACMKVVGLDSLNDSLDSAEYVTLVNEVCSSFEALCQQRNCLALHLDGDSYTAGNGIPVTDPECVQSCVDLCLDFMQAVQLISRTSNVNLEVLSAVHYGSVATGIIGVFRWRYKALSNDLLITQHAALTGNPGRVHVTESCIRFISLDQYEVQQNVQNHGLPFASYYITPVNQRKASSVLSKLSRKMTRQTSTQSFLQQDQLDDEPFYRQLNNSQQDSRTNITSCLLEGKSYMHRFSNTAIGPVNDSTNRSFQQAIWSGAVEAESSKHLNFFTLFFTDDYKEKSYRKESHGFGMTMTVILILLIALSVLHFTLLPRTMLLLGSNLLIFLLISILLILLLAIKLKAVVCKCYTSNRFQTAVLIIIILLIGLSTLLNVVSCRGSSFYDLMPLVFRYTILGSEEVQGICYSDYIYISGIIILFMVAVLRLSHMLQAVLIILITGGYSVVVAFSHSLLFNQLDDQHRTFLPPSSVLGLVALLHFALLHILLVRHFEWMRRLDFIWRHKEIQEAQNAHDMLTLREGVASNCLPSHVMSYYQTPECMMKPYSVYHNTVGVAVVTIPNFPSLIHERFRLGQPNTLIQTLHDVTSAFDHLLMRGDFDVIEKVYSQDLTLHLVSGLRNQTKATTQNDQEMSFHHLCKLIDLLLDMRHCLHQLNAMFGSNLIIRAGVASGPAIEGIYGHKRPQYGIWGPTIDLSKRLEANGKLNMIQVTKELAVLLRRRFQFQARTASHSIPNEPLSYTVMNRRLQSVIASDNDNESIASQSDRSRSGLRNISMGSISQAETVIVSGQPSYMNRLPLRMHSAPGDNLGYQNTSTSSTPAGSMKKSSTSSFRDQPQFNFKLPSTPSLPKSLASRTLSPELPAIHYSKIQTPPASRPHRDGRGTIILTQASLSGHPSTSSFDEMVNSMSPVPLYNQSRTANIVSTDSISRSSKKSQLSPVGENSSLNFHQSESPIKLGRSTPQGWVTPQHGRTTPLSSRGSTSTSPNLASGVGPNGFSFPPPHSPPQPFRPSPAMNYRKHDTPLSPLGKRDTPTSSRSSESRENTSHSSSRSQDSRMSNIKQEETSLETDNLILSNHVKQTKKPVVLGLDKLMTSSMFSDRMQTSMEGNASSESSPDEPLLQDYNRGDNRLINDDPTLSPVLRHQLDRFAKKRDSPHRSPHLSRRSHQQTFSLNPGAAISSLISPSHNTPDQYQHMLPTELRDLQNTQSPSLDPQLHRREAPTTSIGGLKQAPPPKTNHINMIGGLRLPPPPIDTCTESELSDDDNEKVNDVSATDYDNMYSTDYETYHKPTNSNKLHNNQSSAGPPTQWKMGSASNFLGKLVKLQQNSKCVKDLYSELESDAADCESLVDACETDYESEANMGDESNRNHPLQSLQRAENKLLALLRRQNVEPSTVGSTLRGCRSMELLPWEENSKHKQKNSGESHRSSQLFDDNSSIVSSLIGSELSSRSEPDLSDCAAGFDSEYDNRTRGHGDCIAHSIQDIDLSQFDALDFENVMVNENMTTLDYIKILQQQIENKQSQHSQQQLRQQQTPSQQQHSSQITDV